MIIDSHCHFNLEPLYDTLHILDTVEYTNFQALCVGTSKETSTRAIEISKKYQDTIFATAGLHPAYVEIEDSTQFLSAIDPMHIIGVGECGYDFYRSKKERVFKVQSRVFREQIEYACQHRLPLMIHSRSTPKTLDAYDDVISLLSEYTKETGYSGAQIHFFAGNMEIAKKFLDIGCIISFTGVVTYDNALHDVINYVPVDRMLCETDAPYVAPVPYRGSTCYPIYVREVYKKIADLKCMTPQNFEQQIQSNFYSFYKIPR